MSESPPTDDTSARTRNMKDTPWWKASDGTYHATRKLRDAYEAKLALLAWFEARAATMPTPVDPAMETDRDLLIDAIMDEVDADPLAFFQLVRAVRFKSPRKPADPAKPQSRASHRRCQRQSRRRRPSLRSSLDGDGDQRHHRAGDL